MIQELPLAYVLMYGKAQTIAIRLLGSPQATIHYGKSAPKWVQFSQYVLVHSSFQSFEVVIQKAIEL